MPVVQISVVLIVSLRRLRSTAPLAWPRVWETYAELVRWNRASWVSLRPNGVGLQKPNHFGDMARIAWQQRKHPKLTWDILSKGVCDGCALGVAGFHDWTIDGVHLCTTRLRLLSLNTADALDDGVLSDVDGRRGLDGAALRALGRLGHPMRRRP